MRHNVLIVEDDEDLREMMAQILSLAGFNAATATNGREALEYLRRGEAPQLILLDLMMPVMDGWEFQREHRRDPNLADVPVVVLSAVDETRAAEAATHEFMKKPLDFERLLQIVTGYCGPASTPRRHTR
jgi:two-component system chemotaxis response regulator CheY